MSKKTTLTDLSWLFVMRETSPPEYSPYPEIDREISMDGEVDGEWTKSLEYWSATLRPFLLETKSDPSIVLTSNTANFLEFTSITDEGSGFTWWGFEERFRVMST